MIQETYQDIQITYDERENEWLFSLRGRDRTAPSLAKAKEAIDKVPKEKNVFERIPVWARKGYSDRLVMGEITGIATRSYSSLEVWVSFDGERKKLYAHDTYPHTPENDAAVAQINHALDQVDMWRAKYSTLKSSLKQYVYTPEPE